jgi:hypothetical protein
MQSPEKNIAGVPVSPVGRTCCWISKTICSTNRKERTRNSFWIPIARVSYFVIVRSDWVVQTVRYLKFCYGISHPIGFCGARGSVNVRQNGQNIDVINFKVLFLFLISWEPVNYHQCHESVLGSQMLSPYKEGHELWMSFFSRLHLIFAFTWLPFLLLDSIFFNQCSWR